MLHDPVKLDLSPYQILNLLARDDEGEYEGELSSIRQKQGVGKCKYKQGHCYEGLWYQDKRSGIGVMTNYQDEKNFTGHWKYNAKHG